MQDVSLKTYVRTQDFQKQAVLGARSYDTAGVSEDTLRMAGGLQQQRNVQLMGIRQRSSYKGHTVDALVPEGEEGRSELRKATGSRKQASIRGYPNGATHCGSCRSTHT